MAHFIVIWSAVLTVKEIFFGISSQLRAFSSKYWTMSLFIYRTGKYNHHLIVSVIMWAATWQNQQGECAPNEDSDQPGHPPSLIRVFAVRMKKAWVLSYTDLIVRLIWVFAGRTLTLLVLSRRGSWGIIWCNGSWVAFLEFICFSSYRNGAGLCKYFKISS